MSESGIPAVERRGGETGTRSGPRVGVVLAAGRSERLSPLLLGDSKALLRIGGVSLVERAVKGLLRLGLERVVVVVGYRAGVLAALIDHWGLASVETVLAESWEAGNGASLASARPLVADEPTFLLVTTDHVFGEGSLEELARSNVPAALIDHAPATDVWSEGTRVRLHGDRVTGFSKALETPAIDCGAFVLPGAVFDAQRRAAQAGDWSLAGAVNALAETTEIRAVPLEEGSWCVDVDTPADARRAKVALRRSLPRPSDGPVARSVNRPISTRLSMLIAPLRPHPDLLSIVALVAGLAGAWALSAGGSIAGALLVMATSILDGIDGEIARLQLRDGPAGALLDGVLDRVTDASLVAGLAVWAFDQGHGSVAVILAAVSATSVSLLSMATKDRIRALSLPQPPERAIAFTLGGRDGRLLLIGLAALAGAPYVALWLVTATGGMSLLARLLSIRALTSSGRR
jgi:choline kinase/phosphatidylglycerophosphate synthase